MKFEPDRVTAEIAELENFLNSKDAYSRPDFSAKAKRLGQLRELLELDKSIKICCNNISAAEQLLASSNLDPELKTLAKTDLAEQQSRRRTLETELAAKLTPPNPNDAKPAIMEIRAGAGGDEASLFAAELYRMYTKFAEKHRLRVETFSRHETEAGGLKEIIFKVSGDHAYGLLKFEGGVHRVQRVPATESQGRIHTSTVTIAVLPEADDAELEIKPEDLRVDIYRSGGHGGQGVNTTDSAVRITHLPTGLVVTMQDERSQQQNRVKAMTILRTRLIERQHQENQASASAVRKSLIGTGDRSEKIRTYNFPQDRLTDHRIHFSRSHLAAVLDGDLDELITALSQHEKELNS